MAGLYYQKISDERGRCGTRRPGGGRRVSKLRFSHFSRNLDTRNKSEYD